MTDTNKTKAQLRDELAEARLQLAGLENIKDEYAQAEKALTRILDLSRTLVTTHNSQTVLDEAVEAAVDIAPAADRGSIQLLSQGGQMLQTAAVSGPDNVAQWDAVPFRPGVGIAGHALAANQVVNVSDVLADERFIPGFLPLRFRSLLVAPLIIKNQLRGTLSLSSQRVDAFSQNVETMAQLIADHLAVVLENARLFNTLQESEDRYRRLIEASPLTTVVYANDKVVYVNPAGLKLIGATKTEEVIGKSLLDFIHPDSLARVETHLRRAQAKPSQPLEPGEEKIFRLNGEVIDIEVVASPITYQGKPAMLSIISDITERKRAEVAIQRRDAVLKAINFAAERFLQTTTPENLIPQVLVWLNQAVGVSRTHIFENYICQDGSLCMSQRYEATAPGIEPQLDNLALQHLPYEAGGFSRWAKTLSQGNFIYGPTQEFPAGEQKILIIQDIKSILAAPIFVGEKWWGFISFDDCQTERIWTTMEMEALEIAAKTLGAAIQRKKLEEQLLQSQKMEAIGRLAGGVAHDFNNLLTVIMYHNEFMANSLDSQSPLHKNVAQIKEIGTQAASLTRQLLAFSREQEPHPSILDLNAVITDMETMLRHLIGAGIELTISLEPTLNYVKIDPGQFSQVLMNLVINAQDAMPQGGRLTIETANIEPGEIRGYPHVDAPPDTWVLLTISDTGAGMDQKILPHIFEPFFTTKEQTQGTGLGLSTVYGIIQQNNGYIDVQSEPGYGVTFNIYLPQAQAERLPE